MTFADSRETTQRHRKKKEDVGRSGSILFTTNIKGMGPRQQGDKRLR